MIQTITPSLETEKPYNIHFWTGIIREIPQIIEKLWLKNKKVVILTDDTVKWLFADEIAAILGMSKENVISFPAGETSKNLATYASIQMELLKKGYGRNTLIIALWWWVVWDMAWYVASTFTRGVPLIHIPTTLLSQWDSAIWGKNGVDLWSVKNIVGTFYQPRAIVIDPDFIPHLPDDEYMSGVAETVKHAIIYDASFFRTIETYFWEIRMRTFDTLELAQKNCAIKWVIVEKDPLETWLRKILNFWHTIWHAVESIMLQQKQEFKHGFGVSIWMYVESRIAHTLWFLSDDDMRRIYFLLVNLWLPVGPSIDIPFEKIYDLMKLDKKNSWEIPEFSLPKKVWEMHDFWWKYSLQLDAETLRPILEKAIIKEKKI